MARLVLENVSLSYPVYGAERSFRKSLFNKVVKPLASQLTGATISEDRQYIEALQEINLDIKHGERVALVGVNGSGKTTLLRVMAGFLRPGSGRILADGSILPLFTSMPGMDGEDTGYENIRVAAMVYGLDVEGTKEVIDKIEGMSGLGNYLSLPVKTYSAGMTMILNFCFVISMKGEILLIDEGIGAGDARFAAMAQKKAGELVERSGLMILASHSQALVEQMCSEAILLSGGKVLNKGSVENIFKDYNKIISSNVL